MLGVHEARGIRRGEVAGQEVAVRSRESDPHRVGERAGDEHAVDQAWKGVPVLQARVGAAGATDAERRARNAELLDEVLLAHHHRFAAEQRIAVVRGMLQRVREGRVAFAEPSLIEQFRDAGQVALRAALDVPAGWTAEALDRDELVVPSFRRREWCRLCFRRGIVEDGDLVDAAVDGARLDADNEWQSGCGLRHVRGKARGAGERLERRAALREVDVDDPGVRRAVGVLCGTELAPVRERERGGLADERPILRRHLAVRPRDDRARDRVVHQTQRLGPDSFRFRDQPVVTDGQPRDQTDQRARSRLTKRAGDDAPVETDDEVSLSR